MKSNVEMLRHRLSGALFAASVLVVTLTEAAGREAQTWPVPNSVSSTSARSDYVLKLCKETEPTPDDLSSAFRAVDPAYMLKNYFRSVGKIIGLADIKTTLLQDTSHGKITSVIDNLGRGWYRYDPTAGFIGNDQAIFLAEYGGKRYKIILDIKILQAVDDKFSTCPDPKLIKVNSNSMRIQPVDATH